MVGNSYLGITSGWLVMRASTLNQTRTLRRTESPLEECYDFSVEIAMKCMPIESRIVGADLRSLFGQRFAAGRKERVVPCPSYEVFLGRLRELLSDYRGIPRIQYLVIISGSPQLDRNVHIPQGSRPK
jgi:hypothetical protein